METADDRVGFAWGGRSRRTFKLLWSCLITIFASTWTAVHLNIPAPTDGSWALAGQRLLWFLASLAAPEYTIIVALRQSLVCRKSNQTMKKTCPLWTLSHPYYAVMGGYVLEFGNKAGYGYFDPDSHSMVKAWTLFFHSSGEESKVPNLAIWRLCADVIVRLYEDKQSSFRIPEHSEKFIKDRGKTDSLAKLLTCVPVSW